MQLLVFSYLPRLSGPALQLRYFTSCTIKGDDEVEERDGNKMLDALQDYRDRKKERIAPSSVYRSVKHVFSTINIVECLFCMAKIVLSDLCYRMLPPHLEDVLNLL